MPIYSCISLVLLTIIILSNVNSQNVLRQYVIRQDFFAGYKAPEYTVYDTSEKHVYYRIESRYNLLQNIKVIAYPSKQEVARLEAKLKLFLYKAEFSIMDPRSNRRVSGLIKENFKFSRDLFTIEWNGKRLTMEQKFASFTSVFYDSDGGEILAQIRLRPASLFWAKKFDMKIFSNKYPEAIYFLGLTIRYRMVSRGK
jgi:hypothetical protein